MSTKPAADKTVNIPAVDYDFKNLSGAELMAFAAASTKTTAKIDKAKVDAMIAAMVANYEAVVRQLDGAGILNVELKTRIAEMEKTHAAEVKELKDQLTAETQKKTKMEGLFNETMTRYTAEHDGAVAAVARMEGMRETMQTIFAVPTMRESLQRRVLADGTLQEDKTAQQS